MRIHRAVSQLRRYAGVLALGAAAGPAGAQRGSGGRFELVASGHDGGRDRVQLTLRNRDGWSDATSSCGLDAAELGGLDLRRLATDGDSVRFRLVRDAGTIEFAGRAFDWRVVGSYAFTSDARFGDEVARRGYGRPRDDEQFQLALHDGSLALVDELRAERYERGDVADLVRMGQHGVTLAYVQSLDALGFRGLTAADLRTARDHGVTAGFVEAIQRAGFRDASLAEMVRLRDHGVTASFAESARRRWDVRSPAELVRQRDRGDY